jgi:AcrR family transcriptional regulator
MYTGRVTTRASALPPDERRAAIVAAALPLLLERGASVSTREIAEAACIAEGTIFGVFPDKNAVMQAALLAAIDPEPTERALAAIDRALPFEEQLVEAAAIITQRYSRIWRLLATVGDVGSKKAPPTDFPSLTAIFAAERSALRSAPEIAARQLRALVLAVSNPLFFPGEPMSARDIVTLFLDGIRVPEVRREKGRAR